MYFWTIMTPQNIHIQTCFNLTITCRLENLNKWHKEEENSLIYHSQAKKRYSHARLQISTIHQWEANSSCTIHQWLKEIRQSVTLFRGERDLSSKLEYCQRNIEGPIFKIFKIYLYSSGITEIFSSLNQTQPLYLAVTTNPEEIWSWHNSRCNSDQTQHIQL